MVRYSNAEYFDILETFHRSDQNARQAKRLYQELYPDRRQPSLGTFTSVYNRFIISGSVSEETHNRDQPAIEEFEDAVVDAMEENPTSSTGAVAADIGASQSTVWRALAKHGYHPYKISVHHELRDRDNEMRMDFCNWIIALPDPEDFVRNLLFSDESSFSSDGQVNRHNSHYWSVENPHWLRETQRQGRWSINVWCGIFGDYVIGPHFFDGKFSPNVIQQRIILNEVCRYSRGFHIYSFT